MDLYKRFNKLAYRLISKYGYKSVKFVQQTKTGNSWENNFETKTIQTKCIIVPSPKYAKESSKLNGAYDVVESNYVAFIPYTTFIPTLNDKIVTNDKEYSIVSVTRVNPDGQQDILFKLELK